MVGDDRSPVATQNFAYLLFCPIFGIPVTGLFESFSNISKRPRSHSWSTILMKSRGEIEKTILSKSGQGLKVYTDLVFSVNCSSARLRVILFGSIAVVGFLTARGCKDADRITAPCKGGLQAQCRVKHLHSSTENCQLRSEMGNLKNVPLRGGGWDMHYACTQTTRPRFLLQRHDRINTRPPHYPTNCPKLESCVPVVIYPPVLCTLRRSALSGSSLTLY